MTTTEQPAPRAIISPRLAELLQRAMSWCMGARVASQSVMQTADERDRAELPWWVTHHPAVSFRGPQEQNRD